MKSLNHKIICTMEIYSIEEGLTIPLPFTIKSDPNVYEYTVSFIESVDFVKYAIDPPSISHDTLYARIINKCPTIHSLLSRCDNCIAILGPMVCQAMYTEVITENTVDIFIYDANIDQVIKNIIDIVKYDFGNIMTTVGYDVLTIISENFNFNVYSRIYDSVNNILKSCNVPNYAVAMTAQNTFIHKNAIIAHTFRIIPLTAKFKVDSNSIVKLVNCGFVTTIISLNKAANLSHFIDGLDKVITGNIILDMDVNLLSTRVTPNYLRGETDDIKKTIYSFIYHETNDNKKVGPKRVKVKPVHQINNSPPKLMMSKNGRKIDYKKCVHCMNNIDIDEIMYFKIGAKKACVKCGLSCGILSRHMYNITKYEPSLEIACGHAVCPKNNNNNVFARYFTREMKILCECGLEILVNI